MSDALESVPTVTPGVAPAAVSDSSAVSDTDAVSEPASLDLDAIERELADVESALARLDGGTYWTDEVTGGPIPDEQLAADPIARRAAPAPAPDR